MPYTDLLIKDTPELLHFQNALVELGIKGNSLTNLAYARHDRFLKEFLPKITSTIPNCEKRNVIEIGFGSASTSHALSHVFKHIHSFEIDNKTLKIANIRKEIFHLSNITFHFVPPEELIKKALNFCDEDTVFVLFAVLEHMTEEERLSALGLIWDKMGENNYLFVGNTPNRLSHFDLHTHEVPFLFSLPDYTCLQYLKANPEVRFSSELVDAYNKGGIETFSLNRKRRGLGISFHDFEVVIGPELNKYVVLSDIGKPWRFYDALLAAYFLKYDIQVPMCFAIRDLNFLLQKNTSIERISETISYNRSIRNEFSRIVKKVFSGYPDKIRCY
jgi:hypothetical protein